LAEKKQMKPINKKYRKSSVKETIPIFTDYEYIFTDKLLKNILSHIDRKDISEVKKAIQQPT
jgi:hypothetical protein